jgi:hypothetical protein
MTGYSGRLQWDSRLQWPVTAAGYNGRLQWAVAIRLQSARSALHQPANTILYWFCRTSRHPSPDPGTRIIGSIQCQCV